MTDKEVMQMALETLEQITPDWRTSIDKSKQLNNSIETLRTALAQPKKEWVGLTDAELRNAYCEVSGKEWCLGGISNAETFYYAIEAKLKEKNS